jgi:hypothetical protein
MQASLERLRREVDEYGWTVAATVPHYPRAYFTCARGLGRFLLLPTSLSAHGTMINGNGLCAERLSRSVTESAGLLQTSRLSSRLLRTCTGTLAQIH